MKLLVLQGLVCVLISLWGAAMLLLGMVWRNLIWMGLGLAVLIVGLPFVYNAWRGRGLEGSEGVS